MKKWRKLFVRTVLCGLVLLIVMLTAGFIYQWYGERQDAKIYKPLGKLYEVQGGKMHLSTGGQGDITVVFTSGWGTSNPTVDFYPLAEGLATHVKYAVYDRFGYGYSDITSAPRDVDTIVEEIHELLVVSGQKPPYVFVGHSLGALEAIRYAQKYPEEMKGIVMVEGGSPEYYESRKPLTVIPIVQRFLVKSGAARVLYHFDGFAESLADQKNGLKLLPDSLKDLDRVSTLLKGANRNMIDEIRMSRENGRTIMAGTKPLAIPITVLTADYFGKLADDKAWMDYEAALSSWSTAGKQILVPGTSHYLHHYRPDIVIKEILEVAF
ncbi:alpha/beta fold hydrolase [Cohnella sp.]|uniref:alpha/beta fold hydrolase n=1 Tax=Cohnella sp. TaxID=1883426 RepID=UPI00356B5CC9